MQKNWAILLATSAALLAGCGGGGEGSETGARYAAQTVNGPALAAYVGTWQADCSEHVRQSLTISLKNDGSGTLELAPSTSYYAQADCSGPALARETLNTPITATADGTQESALQLTAGEPATTVQIDKIITSLPQFAFHVNGPGADYIVRESQQQWCIDLGTAGNICLHDDGLQQAQNVQAGLVLRDHALYTVLQNNGGYALDTRYLKK